MNIRLPAEWEQQSGIMLTWPHENTDWQSNLVEVEAVYLDLTEKICRFEPVLIVCNDDVHQSRIANLLADANIPADAFQLVNAPSNDSWARDHGPVTVLVNGQPEILDFTFNGWGNKFASDKDNNITTRLREAGVLGEIPCKKIDFVLEGGSIESDGNGTLLTTTSCLLSDQRNPGLDKKQIESKLKEYLGATRILWLEHGHLLGDDTDGHIDTLARFINENTIMYVTTDNKTNPNYASLKSMQDEILQLKQSSGDMYNLVPLPSPVICNENGLHLPASYANFLIINRAVLVPVYDVEPDNNVLDIFADCFVDRKIIPVNCRPLINQFGSLHCITMHFPEGVI